MRKKGIIPILLITIVSLNSCGYNSMQAKEENVFKAWGDLESSLQRRGDLIPNLVATVKGSASHEKETLEAVISARAKATSVTIDAKNLSSPEAMAQFQSAQSSLSGALSKLMMITENYPNLKANQSFRDLQIQLEGTENRIAVSRSRYNEAVNNFNSAIRKFPNSLTNSVLLHLERKEYFKADEKAKTTPKVEF